MLRVILYFLILSYTWYLLSYLILYLVPITLPHLIVYFCCFLLSFSPLSRRFGVDYDASPTPPSHLMLFDVILSDVLLSHLILSRLVFHLVFSLISSHLYLIFPEGLEVLILPCRNHLLLYYCIFSYLTLRCT